MNSRFRPFVGTDADLYTGRSGHNLLKKLCVYQIRFTISSFTESHTFEEFFL